MRGVCSFLDWPVVRARLWGNILFLIIFNLWNWWDWLSIKTPESCLYFSAHFIIRNYTYLEHAIAVVEKLSSPWNSDPADALDDFQTSLFFKEFCGNHHTRRIRPWTEMCKIDGVKLIFLQGHFGEDPLLGYVSCWMYLLCTRVVAWFDNGAWPFGNWNRW